MTQGWLRTAIPPLLLQTECHIWLWNLSAQDYLEKQIETLAPEEVAIARRFIFEEDFYRYVQCHHFMRQILAGYLGCPAGNVRLKTLPSGKPVLDMKDKSLHFSLSHTGSRAMLAVAQTPVGVDIEDVRSIDSTVATVNFSASEQQQLSSYAGFEWEQCFFRCWTRKEALLKAEGIGLTVDLQSFDVEIAHNKQPALLRHEREAGFSKEWKLYDISPSENAVAAVAVSDEVRELGLFLFSPLS